VEGIIKFQDFSTLNKGETTQNSLVFNQFLHWDKTGADPPSTMEQPWSSRPKLKMLRTYGKGVMINPNRDRKRILDQRETSHAIFPYMKPILAALLDGPSQEVNESRIPSS